MEIVRQHNLPPPYWSLGGTVSVEAACAAACAAVVFGFNCHANVVSVFYELEHYPNRIISRLPARYGGGGQDSQVRLQLARTPAYWAVFLMPSGNS